MRYVYVLRAGDDYYKVGIARDVQKRLGTIQTSNPHKIDIVTVALVEDAAAVESAVHAYLATRKADGGREWFKLSPDEILNVCVMIHKRPAALTNRDFDVLALAGETYKALDEIRDALRALARSSPTNTQKKQTKSERDDAEQELLIKAVQVFSERGKASTSLLQSILGIGYGRANRIMEVLTSAGFVSEADGNKPRMLLVSVDDVVARIGLDTPAVKDVA